MKLFRRQFVRGDKPVAHTSWRSPQSKTGSTPFHQSQARRHANYLSPQQRNVPLPEPLLFSHRDYSTLWCSWTIRTGSSSAQSRWMHACEGRLADRGFDSWNVLRTDCVCVVQQARDVSNNEVVAIKKMSYSGKQTNEVTSATIVDLKICLPSSARALIGSSRTDVKQLILGFCVAEKLFYRFKFFRTSLHFKCAVRHFRKKSWVFFCCCAEMAGHHQRGEVPAEASPPQHHRVPGLLPEGAHGMGTSCNAWLTGRCFT